MSVFSEVFTTIKDRRNLSVAQMAEICNIDATTLFHWFGGTRYPKRWKQMDTVVEKLRFSEDEYKELKVAYEKTVLGEEEYGCHKKMIEIFDVLEQRRDEYLSFQENGYNGVRDVQLPEFVKLRNKMEILSWLQNVLEYLAGQGEKKLYLKFQTLHPEVLMLIKMFCSRTADCHIEEVVYLHEEQNRSDIYNLDVLRNIVELLVQRNSVDVYCLEELNYEQGFGENWIMSENFVIQYNEDITMGMLFSNETWMEFYKNAFRELKRQGGNLGKKECDVVEFNISYAGTDTKGFSIEYMPCIGNCLTRELIEEHIYPGIPGREMIIEGLLRGHFIANKEEQFRWDSCFSEEGLIDFMENGRIESFPYMIYKQIIPEARCEILQNGINLMEDGKFEYHMVRTGELPLMRNLYIEQMNGKNTYLVIDMHFDGRKERFSITNDGLQEKFWKFFSHLEQCGYIYSVKETTSYMKKVLKEYKKKFNII